MKTVAVNFLAHSIASIFCLVVFTTVPIAWYGTTVLYGIVHSGDMGGILNFVIVPLFSFLLAFVTVFVLLLPITSILQWLSSRVKLSRWIPLLGIYPASFVVYVAIAFIFFKPDDTNTTLIFLAIWCFVGSVCFALYWVALNATELVLSWVLQFIGQFFPKQKMPS